MTDRDRVVLIERGERGVWSMPWEKEGLDTSDIRSRLQPLVTVAICTYNAGPHLREAVASALAQSYANVEVLVVDDGSTDGSVDPLSDVMDPRLKILRQSNQGKSRALNRALDETRGEFFALLDADDRCSPRRVEMQVAAMLAEPELSAVFCGIELLIGGRSVAPRFRSKGPEECREDLEAMRMPGHDPSGMFRTEFARTIRFDEVRWRAQGYDFILRLGERWPRMRVIGECLYQYRVRPGSMTRGDSAKRIAAVYAVQRSCCERRGLPTPSKPKTERRFSRRERDNNLAAHFIESVTDLRAAGRVAEAVGTGFYCARLYPFAFHYYKALICALLPVRRSHLLRARRARSVAESKVASWVSRLRPEAGRAPGTRGGS